jgi:hypothetical protein
MARPRALEQSVRAPFAPLCRPSLGQEIVGNPGARPTVRSTHRPPRLFHQPAVDIGPAVAELADLRSLDTFELKKLGVQVRVAFDLCEVVPGK